MDIQKNLDQDSILKTHSNQAFTLVEVMISMAIVSIGVVSFANMMQYQNRQIRTLRLASTRDRLVSQISSLVKDTNALSTSANQASNTALSNCFQTGTHAACVTTKQPFTLYDWAGSIVAGPDTSATSTPSGTPRRYDEYGSLCTSQTSATQQCPFEAYVSFTASCTSGCVANAPANSVTVSLTVKTGVTLTPPLKDVTFSATVPTSGSATVTEVQSGSIIGFASATCPTGYTQYAAAQGKFLLGAGGGYAYGSTGGTANQTLTTAQMPVHTHTMSHTHNMYFYQMNGSQEYYVGVSLVPTKNTWDYSGYGYDHRYFDTTANTNTPETGTAGSSNSFSIMPPYLTITWCIKN